ncbi:lipoxygenase homology domain-containing protein 1-like [Physella acuta]|uniref:lipoxygenase homology domain-containing protein 1-like n=1 Tax=Physella acuta TaxID=109671 RepID=UPI0027DE5FFC|nr:lipoxygenase homology domain-containing protein 1-like [Physella acuta]
MSSLTVFGLLCLAMSIQPGFADLVEYKIVVKTGDKLGAGTGSNVFISLFGSRGTTGRIPLAHQHKNSFQRGVQDEFNVSYFNVGRVHSIEIGHDNVGLLSGWFLDHVIVTQAVAAVDEHNVKPGSTTYRFDYNNWISKHEGDGSLVKTIKVASTDVKPA